MTKFEKYLIDNGFVRHYYDHKIQQYVPFPNDREPYYSTMGNIQFLFKKENEEYLFGLHEAGKPPTLIYPRPNFTLTDLSGDDAMNRLLDSKSPEEVIKMINN